MLEIPDNIASVRTRGEDRRDGAKIQGLGLYVGGLPAKPDLWT
jgi:hypothetical protein